MAEVGGLDTLGLPAIDLPLDAGDGPFWASPPDPNAPRAAFAETNEVFRRTGPFEDNFVTDSPLLGTASRISIGRFHVSDTIKPEQFRRVHQTFTNPVGSNLDGTFEIQFTGAGQAVVRQGAHALASGQGALANALLALDDGALLPSPTMYAQSTTFQIRLRMPGYEPGQGGIEAPDPRCFSATSALGRRLLRANALEVFTFGNRSGESRVIAIPYPVGRAIPVIFDIVNLYPAHSAIVDFYVEVFVRRGD